MTKMVANGTGPIMDTCAPGTTITWRNCPQCGALVPHLEYLTMAKGIQARCCGVLYFSFGSPRRSTDGS